MPDFSSLRGFEFCSGFQRLRPSKARILLFFVCLLFFPSHSLPKAPDNWTEKTLKSLSLRDRIAQLVQIRVPGKFINRHSPEYRAIEEQIRDNHVGGVVLFAGDVYESAILLNQLQTASRLPLIVAADFERGLSFRISDATPFPWTMAVGATGSEQYAYQQGWVTGQESRALGVHWIFAPVMDVNNNPDNPVINIRSFGEDPALVARLGSAFIRGARKAQVLTTAKHFPGHGDTTTDSHLGLAVVESDIERLQSVELVPFKSAIEAGVDSIMTAHVAVPNITDSASMPATLSSKILTGLLRDTLRFNGLVVTDALEMAGITDSYWCGLAAVRALQAGADVLLLPPNATVAINEVERAVRRGDIPEARINASVRRILDAKSRLSLQLERRVPISKIGDIVASPQNTQLAQEIADHSITLVRDDQHLLPVNPLRDTRIFSLVLASDYESSPGAAFQTEIRRHFTSVRTAWGNARIPGELLASIEKSISDSDLVICTTLARLTSGQGTIGMPSVQQSILKKLVASRKPFIWVSMGNPYVLRTAPESGTYLCTFSYSDVSQVAAAKAIAGEIPITGKMPVSIPGYAKVGDGLQIQKLPMILRWIAPPDRFEVSRKILDEKIQQGVFRGAEILVGHNGDVVLDFCSGKGGSQNSASDITADTSFELASLSRTVTTASAAMLAIDSGILPTRTPVVDYLPELSDKNTQIQDLLTGLSEIPFPAAAIRTDLIRKIVTRVTGIPYDRYLEKSLFRPLGMEVQFSEGKIYMRGRDLAVFAQMLLNSGMYDHRRYFKPEIIARYTSSRGAWSKPAEIEWMAPLFSSSAFGHLSAEGPALWIDPSKDLFIVLLTKTSDASTMERITASQREIIESIIHDPEFEHISR